MGLFDIFSSKPGETAAANKYDALKSGYGDASSLIKKTGNKITGTINQGYDDAGNYVGTGFDDAGQALTDAYGEAQGLYGDAHNYLQQGTDQAVGAFGDSNDAWQGLYDRGTQGIDMYGTLSGLNGGEAGMNAFQNTPDYLASRAGAEQGLEGIGRSYAGSGQVGRSMTDAMEYMRKYDLDTLGRARSALNPYFGLAESGASGLGQNAGSIANLYAQLGQNQAGVSGLEANAATRYGENNSDLATREAGLMKDLATGRAGDLSSNYWNTAKTRADYKLGAAGAKGNMFQDQYAANQTANKNTWDALLSGTKALTGLF